MIKNENDNRNNVTKEVLSFISILLTLGLRWLNLKYHMLKSDPTAYYSLQSTPHEEMQRLVTILVELYISNNAGKN